MDQKLYEQIVRNFFTCDPEAITAIFREFLMAVQAEGTLPPSLHMAQNYETAQIVAKGLADYAKNTGKQIIVIASSDFNHFESAELGRQKDENVLNKILSLDIEGVEKSVKRHNVSVCGYGPIMAMLLWVKHQNTEVRCRILSRGHSGEVVNSANVVDYISLAFYEA